MKSVLPVAGAQAGQIMSTCHEFVHEAVPSATDRPSKTALVRTTALCYFLIGSRLCSKGTNKDLQEDNGCHAWGMGVNVQVQGVGGQLNGKNKSSYLQRRIRPPKGSLGISVIWNILNLTKNNGSKGKHNLSQKDGGALSNAFHQHFSQGLE